MAKQASSMDVLQISSKESWGILKENDCAILIDVRTKEELTLVGSVDLSPIQAQQVFLPWRNYPEMEIDKDFANELFSKIKKIIPNKNPEEISLLFLCRSGARSLEAAVHMLNFNYNCYNIINGFEGHIDNGSHRGFLNGWKAENLPWRQN